MFEGCTDCGHDNHFNGQPVSAMYCLECEDGYASQYFRNGEQRCVRYDMYWDCSPQAAVTAPAPVSGQATTTVMARQALPQGPQDCDKCFMIG
jgi:hypothetical protein